MPLALWDVIVRLPLPQIVEFKALGYSPSMLFFPIRQKHEIHGLLEPLGFVVFTKLSLVGNFSLLHQVTKIFPLAAKSEINKIYQFPYFYSL